MVVALLLQQLSPPLMDGVGVSPPCKAWDKTANEWEECSEKLRAVVLSMVEDARLSISHRCESCS